MKPGEYFLTEDVQRLTCDQYSSLMGYLKFMGVESRILYDEFIDDNSQDDLVVVWNSDHGFRLLWSYFGDSDLTHQHTYDDMLRMISIFEALL